MTDSQLTIGEVAERAGVATSALRFYEERGLIHAERTEGNQRRFRRSTLRRVAAIRAAQSVGLTLDEIAEAFASLPSDRAPTARDWARLGRIWRERLDSQLLVLERLRDDLVGCIECGCLSLDTCSLVNPGDAAGRRGPGSPRLQRR